MYNNNSSQNNWPSQNPSQNYGMQQQYSDRNNNSKYVAQQLQPGSYQNFQNQNQQQQDMSYVSHTNNNFHNTTANLHNINNNPVNQSQSYFNCNYTCEEHPSEPITNYCSNLECLKELCPECIDPHFKFHSVQNTRAEIESIKNVKNNCSKKLKAAVISLSAEVEKTEMQYLTNPDHIIEEGVNRLARTRDRVIQQVMQYYENLENTFRKRVHENMLKANDFAGIFEQIRSLIQELELLNNQLDTGNTVSVVRKICLLDLKSLMEKFRGDIHKIIDSKDLDPVQIEIDEGKSHSLHQELQRMAKIVQVTSDYHKQDGQSHFDQVQQQQSFQKQQQHPQNNQYNPTTQNNNNNTQFDDQTSSGYYPTPMKTINAQQNQIRQYESQLKLNPQPLQVELEDYYNPGAPNTLSFFLQETQKGGSKLYSYDLASSGNKFIETELTDNQYIPLFHKTITTPTGDIYLIGGRAMDGEKSSDIYKYDFQNKQLQVVAKMKYPRSSHGLVYLDNKIWIIGGYTKLPGEKNQSITGTVEYLDLETNKMHLKASLNHPSVSISVAAFNERYIFKFGGQVQNRQMSHQIEKYDSQFDSWTVIDPHMSPANFLLLSSGCCAQINKSQILVFGGYTQENISSRQCYVFQVDEKDDTNCSIKCINWKPLPQAEGFWNTHSFIRQNKLYAIQNVACSNDQDCLQDERHMLVFSGHSWDALN